LQQFVYPARLEKALLRAPFWARGYFCVTSGEVTEEMIQNYLDHHFELSGADNFRTEDQTGLATRILTLVIVSNPPALASKHFDSDTDLMTVSSKTPSRLPSTTHFAA